MRTRFYVVMVWACVVGLGLLGVSGCGDQAAAAPIVVAGLYNLTGEMAPYDTPVEQGVRLAVKQQNAAGGIHGRQIDYRVQDTATQPGKIQSATSAAISQGAVALLAYDDPDSVLSSAPLAQKVGIPFITAAATSPRLPAQVGDVVFLACFGDNVQAAVGAEFMYDTLKARRAYLLYNIGYDYTRGLADYFAARWEQLVPGGVVLSDTYQIQDSDFSAQVARLKAVQPPPDAIYLAAYPDELPPLLETLRGAGFQQPVVGGDTYDGAAILSVGDQPVSNVYYTTHGALPAPATGLLHDLVEAYTKEYGKAPENIFPALGYDAARLLFDAMNRAPDTSGASIRAALEATKDFKGATGTLTYGAAPDGHVPNKTVTIMEVRDGATVLVDTRNPRTVPAP
jgi:branched-chain amino acid transport system substrate-binding protein